MSPQQEIFNLCRSVGVEVFGEEVYTSRPQQAVTYPFLEISEQQTTESVNKSTVIPTIFQTFHIFAYDTRQGTARRLGNDLKTKLREKKNTKHYYIGVKNIRERTLQDNTTSTALFHIIIEVEFILY